MDRCRCQHGAGSRSSCWILLVVGLAFAVSSVGRAGEAPTDPDADHLAGPVEPENRTHDVAEQTYEGYPIESGFLFADGNYVAPPYIVSRDGDRILINGIQVETIQLSDSTAEGGRHRGGSESRRRRRYQQMVEEFEGLLEAQGIVIVFGGRPTMLVNPQFSSKFLEALVLEPDRTERENELAGLVSRTANPEAWEEFTRSFVPPSDLVTRVTALKERFDNAEASNMAQVRAVRRLDFLVYPLTVVGLVISVLSLGILLQSRPPAVLSWREVDASQPVTRMVVQCTLFVVALSLLDLVYTVLALQANQMHELNPLGSHLIHDPLLLAVFKGMATMVGVGILVSLRRYRGAQMASWWLCLICTVVAFRWLTFSSLFMS